MARSLPEVFEAAERAFAEYRWSDALRGYVAVIRAAPGFTRARYRVADALLNLGDVEQAKTVYKSLAWHFIRTGHPLLGLVVCKMVLALDPTYDDLLQILAELYSSESERVADVPLPSPLPLPDGAPAPDVPNLDAPTLLETAARIAADTDGIAEPPPRFPQIPLFSQLSEDAFLRVLASLRLRRYTDGDRIVVEGQPGDSFFMVADGVVRVSRDHRRPLHLAGSALPRCGLWRDGARLSQTPHRDRHRAGRCGICSSSPGRIWRATPPRWPAWTGP